MEENNFTRKELYDLVWDQPMCKLANKFKIEPQRLKEICEENEIPLPNRGYWSKVRFKKEVIKTLLPKIKNDNSQINLKTRKFKADYHRRAFELEQRKDLKFKVPARISAYHSLVWSTKKLLETIDDSEEIFKFWDVSQEHDILPIHTDLALRSRALRFMDTFIRILETMGHKITFEYSRCHVEMFGQLAEINLRQKVYRIRDKDESGWGRESWEASDKLEFQVGPNFNHKRWIDTQKRKIEECLPEIIAWIEKDCKFWHDLRKQQAEDEKNREIQRAKEAEIQRTKEIEEAKLMQLLTDCDNWHRAKNIRNYISAYQQNAVMKSLDQEKLKTWMDWANTKANELDPLISKEDAVLGFHKA